MAEVPSTRTLALGSVAPDFALPDGRGELHSLQSVRRARGLVVAFVCNHCPFVIHLADEIGTLARELTAEEIGFVAINSNDVSRYPADSPDRMITMAASHRWEFPYLYDESQAVARAYFAACTPDFYLFDHSLRLTYCGQFDSSRPGNGRPVDGADLRAAADALLAGKPPLSPQRPSSGCNIKWKPGAEPSWFQT